MRIVALYEDNKNRPQQEFEVLNIMASLHQEDARRLALGCKLRILVSLSQSLPGKMPMFSFRVVRKEMQRY